MPNSKKIVACWNTKKNNPLFQISIKQRIAQKKSFFVKLCQQAAHTNRKIIDKGIWNIPESGKPGQKMNAHQTDVNRQNNRQTVFRQPKISPAPENHRRHSADRNFNR